MKRLICLAIYHPVITLSIFHLAEVMHRVDYSVLAALLALAAKTISRICSVFDKESGLV